MHLKHTLMDVLGIEIWKKPKGHYFKKIILVAMPAVFLGCLKLLA